MAVNCAINSIYIFRAGSQVFKFVLGFYAKHMQIYSILKSRLFASPSPSHKQPQRRVVDPGGGDGRGRGGGVGEGLSARRSRGGAWAGPVTRRAGRLRGWTSAFPRLGPPPHHWLLRVSKRGPWNPHWISLVLGRGTPHNSRWSGTGSLLPRVASNFPGSAALQWLGVRGSRR